MISKFLLDDGSPDMPAIHRFAVLQAAAARRQGRPRAVRDWGRVVRKALRALRFAARIKAGRVRDDPHSSHSLFTETPEKVFEPLAPTAPPHPDRRRSFREGRRRG
jgi:hypothetical protein